MTTLNDPDQFTDSATDNASTNIYIDPVGKTIKLVPGVGSLVDASGALGGANGNAIYSFLKEEWRTDPLTKNLAAIDFPLEPITDEFITFKDGWDWADATTERLIRRCGWNVLNGSGNVTKHYAAVAVLNAQADDQCYYDLGVGATDFQYAGTTEEAIQVIDDPNGDGNYSDGFDRSSNISVFNREQGQIFSATSSTAVGESSLLAPKLFSLGLPTGADLNITTADTGIDSNSDGSANVAPYSGMSISYFGTAQSRSIDGTPYDFGIIIDGNGGTAEQIYEFVQFELRQGTDIDVNTNGVIGQLADALLAFTGGTGDGSGALATLAATNPAGGGTGVYIDNIQAGDSSRIQFRDNTGTLRNFAFIAAGELVFNTALQNDPDAYYRVFFTDGVTGGLEYGNVTAEIVDDNSGADLSGAVGGNPTIPFSFPYELGNQAGRTPNTPVNVTAIAGGLNGAQYVRTTATISRSTTNSISFVAPGERNYTNS